MPSSRFRGLSRCLAGCLAGGALLLFAPAALAGSAYVANTGSDSVTVINTSTNAPVGSVPIGKEPVDVAITPDGKHAYVANRGENSVVVLDTSTNTMAGAPIPVGVEPSGLAITPDGSRVYVANAGDDTVSVIGTAGNAVIGAPIPVGEEPQGVAITPDGRSAFVAQRGGGISQIDTATNVVVGSIEDTLAPSRIAIGPRGGRAFVTNSGSSSVTAFNPVNGTIVGAPITVGAQPAGIAIEPKGNVAYAASPTDQTLTPIDTSLDNVISVPVSGFPGATGIAFDPRGLSAYVTDGGGSAVTVLDATRNVPGAGIPVGEAPSGIAVAPNQGPTASFFVSPTRARAKKGLTFHAAASRDPDGTIANYAWDFGDGRHAEGPSATRVHRYRKPGEYQVTLAVTDDDGCSTERVYTGQTVYCNGSPAAAMTMPLRVLDATGPKLQLRGPHRQRVRPPKRLLARCRGKACAYRARGVVIASFESAGLVHRRRLRLIGASVLRPSRSWRRLALRVPGRTRRAAAAALRRGGKAKARVTVLATDEAGDQTLRTRKIKLVSGGG